MDSTLSELVHDLDHLISLPDVFLTINRLLDDPNSSVNDIARAVSQDPSFTVRLLRYANSPVFAMRDGVSSVPKAVSVMGLNAVRNLSLTLSVTEEFEKLPNGLMSMENFWLHSLLCALSARILAKQARRCGPDSLFTAGLLHDIGELVIFSRKPEQAKLALRLMLDSPEMLGVDEAERMVMPFDHGQIGGELARQWHLPSVLEECLEFHHRVADAKRHPREVALIHIANSVAQLAELDTLDLESAPPINPLAWELTGLDESCIEPVMREAQAEVAEAKALFLSH